ncbi:hypothetical protein [Thalassomonas sp. RHCl1]|uniref:hypothetical protein n=1 Tax=Thalassomonas sp. RHCl1 TaxID=2995320 RepID=UPI00248CE0B5|nr:hypothetical protein [Thalassomonas sp. RHCl1]
MKNKLFPCLLALSSTFVINVSAFAAGKVNYLNVDEDVVYFSTNATEAASSPACMVAENAGRWTISLSTKNGRAMYSMLATALAGTLDIEVISAQDCTVIDGFERARSVAVLPDLSVAVGEESVRKDLYLYTGDGLTNIGRIVNIDGLTNIDYVAPDNNRIVQRYKIVATATPLYYTGSDCTGTAYVAFGNYTAYHTDLNGGQYMKTGGSSVSNVVIKSQLLGSCRNNNAYTLSYAAYAVDNSYIHPLCGNNACLFKEE